MEKSGKVFLTLHTTHHTTTYTMANFYGEYRAKVDDKGRIVFPSAFKSLFDTDSDLRFVVKKSLFFPCLEMYTHAEWVSSSEGVRSKLNMFNKEHAVLWREFMRDTATVVPDGKVGRILIPKNLLEKVGIASGIDVVFFGADNRIEIWPKDLFEAQKLSDDEFTALAEKILG